MGDSDVHIRPLTPPCLELVIGITNPYKYFRYDCQTVGAGIRGNFPRRVSAYLIGRAAIDKKYQGQGLGRELQVNALHISAQIANYIGGIGVFVTAKVFNAREFYLHKGFEQLPKQSLKLFMSVSRSLILFSLNYSPGQQQISCRMTEITRQIPYLSSCRLPNTTTKLTLWG